MDARRERKELTRRATALARDMGGNVQFLRACADHAMRLSAHQADPRPRCPWDEVGDPFWTDLLRRDDSLGRICQALNASKLESAYRATTSEKRKFAADEIPAVTGLFTPRWVVEFLLQNTLGRTWIDLHPDSRLRERWPFLRGSGGSRVSPRRACDLTILDPACGTMNFGLVAIEMLDAMYREELDHAREPNWGEPSVTSHAEIHRSIARHNLFGIDIDPIALELADATLARTLSGERIAHLHRGDSLFDALPNGWPASFDIVVTNPPYLTSRNLAPDIVAKMKQRYPRSWRDQGTCFIERCLQLTASDGRTGSLTMQTFMFTAAYESLRRQLIERAAVEALAHLGPGVFDVGNPGTLQTVAFTMRNERAAHDHVVQCVRLVDVDDKALALQSGFHDASVSPARGRDAHATEYAIHQRQWKDAPRGAWTYWLDDPHRAAFHIHPKLGEIAPPRQGLATTDNARFVRYWWEVTPTSDRAPLRASADTWFPYVKSGRFRRWYESPRHRVNWADDGAAIKRAIVERYPYLNGKWQWVAKNVQYYFRPGVTYSYLTSGPFSARRLDAGAIFDVAGSSLFPDDALMMLAFLNSPVARRLLSAINPTVNFQVGDLCELPVPPGGTDSIRRDVERAIELTRALDAFDQTAPDFERPLPWREGRAIWIATDGERDAVERRIFDAVADLYGVARDVTFTSPRATYDPLDHARRCVDVALRRVLSEQAIARLLPVDPSVVRDVRDRLDDADGIDKAVGGIGKFLATSYEAWHDKLYRKRPIVWILGDRQRRDAILHDHATSDLVHARDWKRAIDDGIASRPTGILPAISAARRTTGKMPVQRAKLKQSA